MTDMLTSTSVTQRAFGSPGRLRPWEVEQTVFGYQPHPDTPALNRDVFKWVQSLDLSHSLKNVRRDVANGFLVAEIFSRYFPADIQMHGFANATSSHYKRDNWHQLQRFCVKQGFDLPADLVEGTAGGVHGAAVALLEHLYTAFTGKKVQRAMTPAGADTANMPLYALGLGGARSGADTGAKAINTSLKAGAAIGFGAVQTAPVTEGVMAMRRKLASMG